MEGNKDESQRCISIAEKYIANGDKEKALKFLNKAERLYPSTKARVLIERLSNINGSTAGRRKSGETDETREEHINDCSTNEKTEKTKETNNSNSTNYSQEDLDIIRRIRKAKDYYEILGLSKDATENDIKKVYKKLALKMHPDKNQAPGAKEAFQAIGNAYSVLGDVNKRKSYDIRGDEPDRFHSHHDYSRGFEADISAEELFNMFFGGAFPTGHVYSQRHSRNRHSHYHHREAQSNEKLGKPSRCHTKPVPSHNKSAMLGIGKAILLRTRSNGYTLLVQLAPVLMLVFLSLLGSFLVPDATFSLQQSQKYMVKRVTRHLTVPYYVKEDFRVDSQFELRRIERQVEEEYVANLRANCFKERSYKESLLWRARNSGDSNLYKKAMDLDTPSCNRLSTLV